MGTVAVQTQCCLQQRDESDEEEASQEEKVQLMEPVHWCSGGSLAGAPTRAPAAVPRSVSETTTFVPTR